MAKNAEFYNSINTEEKWFNSSLDNADIFYRLWKPTDSTRIKSVIQLTHGICEHSNRYDEFARELSKNGHLVFGIDLRGHGKTGIAANQLGRAPIDFWDRMLSDINQLTQIIKTHYKDIPLIAFGHSMGSVLTQSHMQRNGTSLDAAILSGTLGNLPGGLDIPMKELKCLAIDYPDDVSVPFQIAMQNLNSMIAKNSNSEVAEMWMTTSIEETRKFLKDKLSGKPFTNAMMFSVFDGFKKTWNKSSEMNIPKELPILICAGSADPISYNGKTCRNLIKRYINNQLEHISFNFYFNDRHEVWNGNYKNTFLKDTLNFIDAVLSRSSNH
ncbi:TPA: alpha/beta hydrolase [Enterobacter hormaechei]|jgi:alpha-beta hydrolase superfamily lysophospholipase|nr:hypothetical protein A7J56_21170 [Enterobacter cloacae]OAE71502.1 hypothetical protein A7J58_21185 [Enterobacter cloacae]